MIVVQKGERTVGRLIATQTPKSRVTSKLATKFTVTYTMSATDVEVKAGKGGKKEAKAAPTP